MNKPIADTRYLITEDDKQTAAMMWLSHENDTHYIFNVGETQPYENGSVFSRKPIVRGIAVPKEMWDEDYPLPFEIIKTVPVNPYKIGKGNE